MAEKIDIMSPEYEDINKFFYVFNKDVIGNKKAMNLLNERQSRRINELNNKLRTQEIDKEDMETFILAYNHIARRLYLEGEEDNG